MMPLHQHNEFARLHDQCPDLPFTSTTSCLARPAHRGGPEHGLGHRGGHRPTHAGTIELAGDYRPCRSVRLVQPVRPVAAQVDRDVAELRHLVANASDVTSNPGTAWVTMPPATSSLAASAEQLVSVRLEGAAGHHRTVLLGAVHKLRPRSGMLLLNHYRAAIEIRYRRSEGRSIAVRKLLIVRWYPTTRGTGK